jgi:hypothetical protein
MQRIWPPEPEQERPMVLSEGIPLRDWCVRFEVNLPDPAAAERFAGHYRARFPSSAATSSGPTAWITFRTGAADERDAAMLAAMTVKIVSELRLVRTVPTGARVHFTDDLGEIPGYDQHRRRAEREALLDYAKAVVAPPSQARITAPPVRRHLSDGKRRWLGFGGGVA